MLNLFLALLAGVVTIAAPCTLPVLPILLGASVGKTSKARPVMIASGFVLSFSLVALALSAITPAEYSQWLNYTHWQGAPAGYEGGQGATGTDYLVTITGYSEFGRNVSQLSPVKLGSCSY